MKRTSLFFLVLAPLLLFALPVHAQLQLKAGNFNSISVAGAPRGTNETTLPPTPNSNFRGMGQVSGSAGPKVSGPAGPGPITPAPTLSQTYPHSGSIVLVRCTIGGMFASGVPLYFLGDEINPPLTDASGAQFTGTTAAQRLQAARVYWREKPILPGEVISGFNGGLPLVPLDGVLVSASSNSTTVNVAAQAGTLPGTLVVGATLLGQPITKIVLIKSGNVIDGATVTLADKANETVSGEQRPINPATPYYYSPHSEKVYASQPGFVSITWIRRQPSGQVLDNLKTETFTVSASSQRPVRRIFWTENGFDGPVVRITDGRITTVSPAYYSVVPKAVGDEVTLPGTPPSGILSTLSFSRNLGAGTLRAYNVEGRILIEYLGTPRVGAIFNSIGTDVVELVRSPEVNQVTTHLGKELRPHDGDTQLEASPVSALTQQQGTPEYYGKTARPDQSLAYWAERETSAVNDPDNNVPASADAFSKVAFYWLERGDFNIRWPKFQDRYWQRWSPDLADYAFYTVDASGSTPATGISFSGGTLPQIVFQDDGAENEAKIDVTTQRLFLTFSGGRKRNRSLLKFSSSGEIWYVNLYTQAEDRRKLLTPSSDPVVLGNESTFTVTSTAGLEVGMIVTGPENTGAARITKITATTFTVVPVAVPSRYQELAALSGLGTGPQSGPTGDLDGDSIWNVAELAFGTNALDVAEGTRPLQTAGSTIVQRGQPVVIPNPVAGGAKYAGAFVRRKDAATWGLVYTAFVSTDLVQWQASTATPTQIAQDGDYEVVAIPVPAGPSGRGFFKVGVSLGTSALLPSGALTFTVESDEMAPIYSTSTVGSRILPPGGHEVAGYISGGRGYYPAGYLNPFVVGFPTANLGAIIPVNALPSDNALTVRWYKKISAPSASFQDLYIPGKIGRYTSSYPATTSPQIVIASGIGTGDLPPAEAAGSIYYGNIPGAIGFNPNEEHALILGGRAYALREDLNVYQTAAGQKVPATGYLEPDYTSEPFVLVAYTDPSDQRPAMHAYKVVREVDQNSDRIKDPGDILFDYTATAGTLLVKPYPLPLLPIAFEGTGASRKAKDVEITGTDNAANGSSSLNRGIYDGFTFQDRKGFPWVHRGPHSGGVPGVRSSIGDGSSTVTVTSTLDLAVGMSVTGSAGGNVLNGTIRSITDSTRFVLSQTLPTGTWNLTYGPTLTMNLYYVSQSGFYVPGLGEPAVGTILPFLRSAERAGTKLTASNINAGQTDEPLAIIYRPTWPENAPELAVNETLTLPKFGLPQVRGQKSAQVLYEQSVARDASATSAAPRAKSSVTLFDPTREKTFPLPDPTVQPKILSGIKTTSYRGKTYFQGLPPHLQQRLYFDPVRGQYGTLVFRGSFHDEPAGEDYLDLNVLTDTDVEYLDKLASTNQEWQLAYRLMRTSMETFVPDPARSGNFTVDATRTRTFYTLYAGDGDVPIVSDPDTAVDSYALTATGKGTGYVTLVFGNGKAFTPEGDPVQVKVIKISDQLYTGDLKVLLSSNPLDEQVTLRHSADFAGKPEDYEFEWRWATGEASAPATYATLMTTRIGDPAAVATRNWVVVRDPGAQLPTAAQYDAVPPNPYPPNPVPFPRTENVRPVNYYLNDQRQPIPVPATKITFATETSLPVGTTVTDTATSGSPSGKIVGKIDSTRYVVSPALREGNVTFRFTTPGEPSRDVECSSSLLTSNVIEATSYTDAEIAAGYPSLVAKSTNGIDFTGGVPGTIVFSADLGSFDGFVLYVNGRAAVAHKAPESLFTNTPARTDLITTPGRPKLSSQFNVEPNYFTAGPNTIEVAIYTEADPNVQSALDFRLEAAQETDLVTSGNVWQIPGGQTSPTSLPYGPSVVIGGNRDNLPFGGPNFVLNDRWFTMRYRPKAGVLAGQWSRWLPPQFVEGWVKRVLAAINPFEQRVKDLYNNAVNTDVSVVAQAGQRWEGDIALTLENVNDAGLIEIYETVLNRAKGMSIDANTNDPDSNNALLLAAGYLNDLYMLLGNEAYADAANPTISVDDQSNISEVNTSRFSFEGQVANFLDEELALLRGRGDYVSPGVRIAPAYNRLYWNYTRGINGGEALYAVNYNIKEKVGSSTANGVIDEADAQRMFPQGHGDAYGHYLTALTGYYRLLTNSNFTWVPRAEAVTVLGQPVTVDFFDERKFAGAGGSLARAAQQICALTYRQSYKDDPAGGWTHFRDSKGTNTQTGITSAQGLDEWVSRSAQGAYLHWAMANALVPDVDNIHTGVQKIDRTTVPEIAELATSGATFQTTIDNANARLNPLGFSPGAIAFDIDPTFLFVGSTAQIGNLAVQGLGLFEQIYQRALATLNNAAGAFNQAAVMTRSLRNQENLLDDYNTVIAQQEVAYMNQLIDIYGRPYSGDIGPGKTYAQAYVGPDLEHWFIVDRPTYTGPTGQVPVVDTTKTFSILSDEAEQIAYYTDDKLQTLATLTQGFLYKLGTDKLANTIYRKVSVTVQPGQWVQYKDVWNPNLGTRAVTGELQEALLDAQQTYLALSELNVNYQKFTAQLDHLAKVFSELVKTHKEHSSELQTAHTEFEKLEKLIGAMNVVAAGLDRAADSANDFAEGVSEHFDIDPTDAPPKLIGAGIALAARVGATITDAIAAANESDLFNRENTLERSLTALGFKPEEVQLAYEYDTLFRDSVTSANEMMQLALAHQRALQNVNNVLARGQRVLDEREVFRQRAAAIIQGYRTRDLSFRIFRNEALEQYRSLFDLASRYTYLVAKGYDYETGLLGSAQGQAVFSKIIASRSLGDLTGGNPVASISTLGDAGLAGMMARMDADYSIVQGRLGLNNPDQNGTVFSLREELFRLVTDEAWQQTLEQHRSDNLLNDQDVILHCRNIRKPDGSPVPGFILSFSTTIEHGMNFFGLPLAGGDHNYSPSNFATKIATAGIVFEGYIGMDDYTNADTPPTPNDPNSLSATPYVYLIPCGTDYMLAPPLGDTNTLRSWDVKDQAVPLPFNLGGTAFNSTQFFNANGTLSEQPWIIRKHQAFRAVSDPTLFYGAAPVEFLSSRLIARSVWNSRWKIIIPAYSLLNNEQEGMRRFAASVKDIKLFLRTYSNSGN